MSLTCSVPLIWPPPFPPLPPFLFQAVKGFGYFREVSFLPPFPLSPQFFRFFHRCPPPLTLLAPGRSYLDFLPSSRDLFFFFSLFCRFLPWSLRSAGLSPKKRPWRQTLSWWALSPGLLLGGFFRSFLERVRAGSTVCAVVVGFYLSRFHGRYLMPPPSPISTRLVGGPLSFHEVSRCGDRVRSIRLTNGDDGHFDVCFSFFLWLFFSGFLPFFLRDSWALVFPVREVFLGKPWLCL